MMKLNKLITIISSAIILTGCAGMTYTNTDIVEDIDFPKIGEQTTVYVGDAMLIQGTHILTKVLSLEEPATGMCYDVSPGKYRIAGEDEYKYYFKQTGEPGGIKKGALCDRTAGLYVSKDNLKEVCVITVYNTFVCNSANRLSIDDVEIASLNHVQRSLLYSGRENDQLKFTYVQQPSGFTHNVTYNIKTSDVIGYRGAQIKVHSADNEKITYTLLKNFPDRTRGN